MSAVRLFERYTLYSFHSKTDESDFKGLAIQAIIKAHEVLIVICIPQTFCIRSGFKSPYNSHNKLRSQANQKKHR